MNSPVVKDLIQAYSSTVLVIATFIVGIFLLVIRQSLEQWASSFLNWISNKVYEFLKKRRSKLSVDQIRRENAIHEILIELRTIINADRTYIYQFHNGSEFNATNPIWKISKTHESVQTGVSPEVARGQSLLSSSLIDLISCFWINTHINGIEALAPEHCGDCGHCEAHGVFLVDVEQLRPGYVKAFLQEQGVKYSIIFPLVDGDNRIGFLGVDYTEKITNLDTIKAFTPIICKHGMLIGYTLLKKI